MPAGADALAVRLVADFRAPFFTAILVLVAMFCFFRDNDSGPGLDARLLLRRGQSFADADLNPTAMSNAAFTKASAAAKSSSDRRRAASLAR